MSGVRHRCRDIRGSGAEDRHLANAKKQIESPLVLVKHSKALMGSITNHGMPDEDELYCLQWVFSDGPVGRGNDAGWQRRQYICELKLPTGQLLACDPMLIGETQPLHVAILPGEYAVILCLRGYDRSKRNAYEVPSFVEVRLREGEVRHWRALAPRGVPPHDPDDRQVWGYPVDSATGALMDASIAGDDIAIQAGAYSNTDQPILFEQIEIARDRVGGAPWWLVEVHLSTGSDANVIGFDTGSDGTFACYGGYSETGDLLCVVNDLAAFDMTDAGL
jgi:hypothetical protein